MLISVISLEGFWFSDTNLNIENSKKVIIYILVHIGCHLINFICVLNCTLIKIKAPCISEKSNNDYFYAVDHVTRALKKNKEIKHCLI